ncbi:hypothetical protein [Arcticibacter eurypsychrophilus]|uniref:hypothetical protein n=1 Tax=Arcticibacter eurypsychrophilus TaxID=1434752 RepID=UPI00084DF4A8|nr:hypothetical protein [Arcticibacter eurypsychrophilus]
MVAEGYSSNAGNITTNISVSAIPTFQQEAEDVLGPLNKSFVTTGILYDRVFPLANLESYKGLASDDTTSSVHFTQAYSEIYNSLYNKTGYKTPEELESYLTSNYTGKTHTIGALFFKYNYLDTNAIKNNQIYVSNGKLYDTPNRTSSPYIEATTMIASPLFPAEAELEEGSHTFTFDPTTVISNSAFNIAKVNIDFGMVPEVKFFTPVAAQLARKSQTRK